MPQRVEAINRVADSIIKSIEQYNKSNLDTINFQTQLMMDDYKSQRELQNLEKQKQLESEYKYKYDPIERARLAAMASQYPELQPELERFGIKPYTPQVQQQGQGMEVASRSGLPGSAQFAQAPRRQNAPALSPIDTVVNNIYNKGLAGEPLSVGEARMIKDQPPQFIRNPNDPMKVIKNPEYDYWLKKVKYGDVLPAKDKAKMEENDEKARLQTDMVISSAQDTLDTLAEIEKGIKYFGAAGNVPSWPMEYSKKNWEANVDKLRSKLVVDLMNNMKQASKTGATGFGQLSQKELELLQNAATALKKGLSEEDAKRYLNEIRLKAYKVMAGKQGGIDMTGSVPQVGEVFNGERVLSIRRVK